MDTTLSPILPTLALLLECRAGTAGADTVIEVPIMRWEHDTVSGGPVRLSEAVSAGRWL